MKIKSICKKFLVISLVGVLSIESFAGPIFSKPSALKEEIKQVKQLPTEIILKILDFLTLKELKYLYAAEPCVNALIVKLDDPYYKLLIQGAVLVEKVLFKSNLKKMNKLLVQFNRQADHAQNELQTPKLRNSFISQISPEGHRIVQLLPTILSPYVPDSQFKTMLRLLEEAKKMPGLTESDQEYLLHLEEKLVSDYQEIRHRWRKESKPSYYGGFRFLNLLPILPAAFFVRR